MPRVYKQNPGAEDILAALRRTPDIPARTLARQLYARNPALWSNMENCRQQIRFYLGQHGSKDRKHLTLADYVREPRKPGSSKLPSSDATEPVIVNIRERRIGIMCDVHIPYHDELATETAIAYLRKLKLDALLLNGDIVDFHKISRFQVDPRKRSTKEELMALWDFLNYVRGKFPKIPIYYKIGNHEKRLESYLIDKARELLDVTQWRLQDILPMADIGISVIESQQLAYAGRLTIIHGHEYPTPVIGPVNAARGLFLRASDSALVGHHHQSSEHISRAIRGQLIGCWSVGCLCGLSPEYAVLNKWGHGVAHVEIDEKGGFEVHNRKIIDGKVR